MKNFLAKVGRVISTATGIAIMAGGLYSGFTVVVNLFDKLCVPTIQKTFFDFDE